MAETHAHPDERVYGNAYLPTGAVHTGDTVGVSVFMSTGRVIWRIITGVYTVWYRHAVLEYDSITPTP
eukprot:3795016-Pleurochrysis_carterae.AAC.1